MNALKVFILSFVTIFPLLAQNPSSSGKNVGDTSNEKKWILKFGLNYSAFRGDDNQIINGISLGLNRKWELTEMFKISSEILFTSQGGYLDDKPVRPQGDEIEWYLYSWDVKCKAYYIEFPIFINYDYTIEPLNLNFYFGPSYRFGLTEHSERTEENLIYDDSNPEMKEKYEDYNFEFYQTDREFHVFPQSGFGLNLGLNVNYSLFLFDFRYSYSLHKIGGVEQLEDVNRKSHALHLMFGYKF